MNMRLPLNKTTHKGHDFLDWTGQTYHPGVDYNRDGPWDDLGDPVFAYRKGRVEHVQYQQNGYGNMVIVKHRNRWSKYAHLKDIYVKVGDWVNTFEPIGTIGNTGASNAPHLHFEILRKRFDPNFYPVGKSVEWVANHYDNPNVAIFPRTITVRILANKLNWDSWNQKLKNVKDWYKRKTANQIDLQFDVKQIAVEPVWKLRENGKSYLDPNWVNSTLMPKASGKDICVYVQDWDAEWKTQGVLAYADVADDVGVEFIAMRAGEFRTHTKGIDKGVDKRYFEGVLKHELCHTLIQMHNRHSLRRVKDRTHEFDFNNPSKLDYALHEIDFEDLIGFNIPGKIRLFKRSYRDKNKIIHRILNNTSKFRLTIRGFKRAGFTEYIPGL